MLIWALSTFGLTAIIVDGKIMAGCRAWLRARLPAVSQAAECYQCSGLYAGMITYAMTAENPTLAGWIIHGLAGSGLSMFAAAILNRIEGVAWKASTTTYSANS